MVEVLVYRRANTSVFFFVETRSKVFNDDYKEKEQGWMLQHGNTFSAPILISVLTNSYYRCTAQYDGASSIPDSRYLLASWDGCPILITWLEDSHLVHNLPCKTLVHRLEPLSREGGPLSEVLWKQ